ncbi:MAG: hypothetical protein ACLQNE_02960 [Thermoguttaceae bacterium]
MDADSYKEQKHRGDRLADQVGILGWKDCFALSGLTDLNGIRTPGRCPGLVCCGPFGADWLLGMHAPGLFAQGNGLPGTPTLVVLGILAAIIAALLIRTQRSYAQRPSGAPPFEPHARHESMGPSGDRRDTAEAAPWRVSMHETARELSAELDAKINALAAIVRDADRAAARLEAALAAAGRLSAGVGDAIQPAGSPSAAPVALSRPALAGQAEGLRAAGATERGATGAPEQEPTLSHPSAKHRQEEIYSLADQGYEPAQIAQQSGMPVGEVQLILGLRSAREKP